MIKILKSVLYIAIIGIFCYFEVPSLVLTDISFYFNISLIGFVIFGLDFLIEYVILQETGSSGTLDRIREKGIKGVNVLILLPILSFLVFSTLAIYDFSIFQNNKIKTIIKQETKSFKEFPNSNINNLPIMSRDTAAKLADRYLGSIKKASQFKVSDEFTQITYKGRPVRVSPLKYSGFPSWFNNHKEGITQYIMVDMFSQKVSIVNLKHAIHYSGTEFFNHDINRHLKFKYPTKLFNNPSFEIDENGDAYYVATTYKNYILGDYKVPDGVILVNASTGDTHFYHLEGVPKWVDRIYPEDYIQKYINLQNQYVHGVWNSLFGKRDVKVLSKGYNYLTMNDTMYLYSGITTVSAPNSNLGFVLVNLRNGEVTNYKLSSATETSAQESAENEVSEKKYSASFPSLIKFDNRAGYLMSLSKDSIIKKYAVVDAVNYQKVYIGNTVQEAIDMFRNDSKTNSKKEITGFVSDIKTVVINGYTYYYIKDRDGKEIYKVSIKTNDMLPYISINDKYSGQLKSNSNEFIKFEYSSEQ